MSLLEINVSGLATCWARLSLHPFAVICDSLVGTWLSPEGLYWFTHRGREAAPNRSGKGNLLAPQVTQAGTRVQSSPLWPLVLLFLSHWWPFWLFHGEKRTLKDPCQLWSSDTFTPESFLWEPVLGVGMERSPLAFPAATGHFQLQAALWWRAAGERGLQEGLGVDSSGPVPVL